MTIEDNRAISINSLNGDSFPVSIEFEKENEVYRLYLLPISVSEVISLIRQETFLVFNVDANEYDGLKPVALERLTEQYSSYWQAFDDETLLIDKQSLIKLLSEISHYNFCLIDAEKEIKLDKVIQIIDLADKWSDLIVINEANANIFLSSHDDCYLYLETNEENLALDLIGLQVKILVSTAANLSVNKLNFNPKELITKDSFSIVIPQKPVISTQRITWNILEGTFKDFVYSNEMRESAFELVYEELTSRIKIERV